MRTTTEESRETPVRLLRDSQTGKRRGKRRGGGKGRAIGEGKGKGRGLGKRRRK